MLNIHDLEKRHKAYKLKLFLPYIVIVFSLSVIIIVIFFLNNSNMFKSNEVKSNKKIIQTQLLKPQKPLLKELEEKNEITKKNKPKQDLEQNTTLLPSLNFISNIKHNSLSNEVKHQRVSHKEEEPQLQKASSIKIHRQSTQNNINDVIKRFEKKNNPALSLFIAKSYYELKDYHQSYNYALITNRINENLDASWIIFAKSLVKLNKKDEAIETLKKYIDHSGSTQAKTLLEEIQREKFK